MAVTRTIVTRRNDPHEHPSAPQRPLHAGIQSARHREGADAPGGRGHSRPRRLRGAGREGSRARADQGRRRCGRLRCARSDRAHQCARYRLVDRGPRHGREGEARCGAGAQGLDPPPSGRCGRPACRYQRGPQDPGVGDDGDAARHAQCARDRGGGGRRGEPACGLRDGHQRSRQGDAGKDHSRPFRHAAVADGLHRGGARLRPRYPRRRLQRSRRCARASRANAPRRGIWVSTARP